MSRLKGQRCYLAGPIEFAQDLGMGWRNMITPQLEAMGIDVVDPNKVYNRMEESKRVELIKNCRETNNWDLLTQEAKLCRNFDLRLVDISDFLIVAIDPSIPTCGTWEEIFWANRSKKPILVVWKGGKKKVSYWFFGTIPHQYIFETFDELLAYLKEIQEEKILPDKRWVFKNHQGVYEVLQ